MADMDLNEGEGEAIASRQFSPIHFSLPESTLEELWNDAGPLNSDWVNQDTVMEPATSSSSQVPMEVDSLAIAAAEEAAARAAECAAMFVAQTKEAAEPELAVAEGRKLPPEPQYLAPAPPTIAVGSPSQTGGATCRV